MVFEVFDIAISVSSDSYKIEVMIISLLEIAEFPNLVQMITSTIKFGSRDKFCW